MTYTKPKNMKYVDMCKYFDEHFHVDSAERDDYLLYQYMYHIVYMLACKQRYFNNFDDYDEFAIFASNILYTRFDKFEREGRPVKSILNYIKATLYALKATYISKMKTQDLTRDIGFDTDGFAERMKSNYQFNYNRNKELPNAIIGTIRSLPYIASKVVLSTPYRNDKLMMKRLYQSCMLSLLNEFTMSNYLRHKIDGRNERSLEDLSIDSEMKMMHKEYTNNSGTILWNLPDKYKDYVTVLTRRIKNELSKELLRTENEYRLEDNILNCMLKNFTDSYESDKE